VLKSEGLEGTVNLAYEWRGCPAQALFRFSRPRFQSPLRPGEPGGNAELEDCPFAGPRRRHRGRLGSAIWATERQLGEIQPHPNPPGIGVSGVLHMINNQMLSLRLRGGQLGQSSGTVFH
jgi:hypothetical protein